MDPTTSSLFDVNSVTEQLSAEVDILHPVTRLRTGARIILAGPEHPERKRLQFDRQRKLRAMYARKGRFDPLDPAEEEAEEIDHLAACTLGWHGIAQDGHELAFTPSAARELYLRPEMHWLRRQLLGALADHENFIHSSVTA